MAPVRSVVFRFEDIGAFSDALAEAPGALPIPAGESAKDGEWVLAIFEIGSRRRATAAAARAVRAAGDPHLAFERRDWDRLMGFVAARSEHMRAARPISSMPSSSGSIPIASPEAIEMPPSSVGPLSSRAPLAARVLLVDDDEDTRDEVQKTLTEVGLRVELAAGAEAARARIRTEAFDAIVLDLHTPGLSALDLVRDLRGDPRNAPIPVLLLADSASSKDVVRAFASGADDFLAKPVRGPELGARIIGLLQRARANVPKVAPGGRA